MLKVGISVLLIIATASLLEQVEAEKKEFPFRGPWAFKPWNDARREDAKDKIRFLLRDREGQAWKKMSKEGSVPEKIWVADGPLKILIHSYSAQFEAPDAQKILKDQNMMLIGNIYSKENTSLNVIIVDWTQLAVDTYDKYHEIVKNVPYAAEAIYELLFELNKNDHVKDFKKVHIIGFGMGAHVGGVVGKKIQDEKDDWKIGRITGLDPNGPGFSDNDEKKYKNDDEALTKKDAEFVDVIHCNMGKTLNIHDAVIKGRYGSMVQAGSVDFYPNGGEKQAGCNVFDEKIQKPCSQRRCSEMFAHSITEKYLACPCDDYGTYQKGTCDCTKDDGGVLMGAQCCPGSSSKKSGKKRLYLNTLDDGMPKGGKKDKKKDKKKKDKKDDDEKDGDEKDEDKKDDDKKDTIADDDDGDKKDKKKDKKKKKEEKKDGSDEVKDEKDEATTKKPKEEKKKGSDEEKDEKKDGSGEEKKEKSTEKPKKKSSEEK